MFRTRGNSKEDFSQKYYKPQTRARGLHANANVLATELKRKYKRVVKPTYQARRWPMPGEGTRERA